MKIRNGFVTNSSSSSYIIGFKTGIENEENKESEIIKNYIDILDAIFPKENTCSTIEELNNDFLDKYSYKDINTIEKILDDDEYLHDKYNELKKHIENGYYICCFEIKNSDKSYSNLLYKICKNENFIMLENE